MRRWGEEGGLIWSWPPNVLWRLPMLFLRLIMALLFKKCLPYLTWNHYVILFINTDSKIYLRWSQSQSDLTFGPLGHFGLNFDSFGQYQIGKAWHIQTRILKLEKYHLKFFNGICFLIGFPSIFHRFVGKTLKNGIFT